MIVDRRSFVTLLTAAASSLLYGCKSSGAAGKLGIPGLFPGRVVSVHHSGSHTGGEFQLEPIRSMMRRGIVDLTGAPDWIAAWRLFFERGDVVGIKVNPVGWPDVISCADVLREIIAGLNLPVLKHHQSAGVTLALKNLSHGLVNNVCRSHSSSTLNACGIFIPAVVNLPVIREKTVLHVLDGILGMYHGGPGGGTGSTSGR